MVFNFSYLIAIVCVTIAIAIWGLVYVFRGPTDGQSITPEELMTRQHQGLALISCSILIFSMSIVGMVYDKKM